MQVRFKTGFRNTILDVMRRRPGWKESTSDMDWDFHWADREWIYDNYHYIHLEHWQRMNHFRNDRELCRKDLLIRNVKKHRRRLEREKRVEEARLLDFCPPTYILPNDYALFVEEFKKRPGTAWIMKPVGRSQGKGIFLFRKLSEIAGWRAAYKSRLVLQNPHAASAAAKAASGEPAPEEVQTYVAQRYIAKPYLVGGKKFDMRIYALVTSFSPLTCYLYRRGFARFSATRYSNSAATQGDTAMHLTNVAIQKKSTRCVGAPRACACACAEGAHARGSAGMPARCALRGSSAAAPPTAVSRTCSGLASFAPLCPARAVRARTHPRALPLPPSARVAATTKRPGGSGACAASSSTWRRGTGARQPTKHSASAKIL